MKIKKWISQAGKLFTQEYCMQKNLAFIPQFLAGLQKCNSLCGKLCIQETGSDLEHGFVPTPFEQTFSP
jgi:hypothetical protein